ncbi:unnamed protein product [Aureobasidium mustum]|uniref:Uncharacterized protein n=1 Tax=Aureobasidium mustum TaxID=2773714 RepID=A0A9N8K3Q3_9PEZI|nr:unnamed protein product [Aureobasidium mustum]
MSNVPAHLPGDLGEHDPRREAHPVGNEPGSGGHEVKLGSAEAKGIDSDATAAENSNNNNPRSDNTAEHAMEGGSTETMDRHKRQQASSIPGGRTGQDGVDDHLTRAGREQETDSRSNYGDINRTQGSGLTGSNTHSHHHHDHHHGSTGSGLTGSGLTGGYSQSGTEPISGVRGAGVGGAPYDAGNVQSTGFSGSDPQERHQLHHGTAHHPHDFSHNHNTRTGELLDPASGRDTGIPGYTGGASGLTGSSTAGTGYGQTGTGLTGSSHTGYGQTGSTGERLREGLREGERGLSGSHTGTGLTGSHTGTGLTGSSTTGAGYGETGYGQTAGTSLTGGTGLGSQPSGYGGQTGSTGERLREDVREGERGLTGTSTGHHGSTGSGLTGSTTGQHESTGERVRDDVREGERATGHDSTGTTGEHKKASLLDKLNPMKDADGDGKKGFMK